MRNTLLWIIIAVTLLALALACGQHSLPLSVHENASRSKKEQDTRPSSTAKIIVKSVDFYTWWWSEEQLRAGVYRQETIPPRNTYTKVDRWRDTGDADVLHPDLIDIVCKVENAGSQPVDLVISAIGDLKVATFEKVQNDQTEKTIKEVLEDVPWTEERHIGQTMVQNIAPGESREIKFKDFNLIAVIDNYSDDKNGVTWPWFLRARIIVEMPNGVRVAQREAGLEIIPGD